MKHIRINNYRLFLAYSSILALAIGLFMPFYIVFIQGFGKSIENFGFAIGLMALAEAITAYFIGKHSDALGRKIFIIVAGYATGTMLIVYTLITTQTQLYILQIINGIFQATEGTMVNTVLADVTVKQSRGADVGRYRAITGVMGALAMMGGGYVAGALGIKVIFYIGAVLYYIGTTTLIFIKEK